MNSSRARFSLFLSTGLLLAAGCKGATNDDSNFIVLTARASISAGGFQATGPSSTCDLTPDGRFVVFSSRAPDLVPNDTNGNLDIFRKDLVSGQVLRVSVEHPSNPDGDDDGLNANEDSFNPAISADGRFVVYASFDQGAGDIVPGDTNFSTDVFLADLLDPQNIDTVRVSLEHASDPDGDFDSDRNANSSSQNPDISDDGRYIVFDSFANDLVVADFVGGTFNQDVFLFDRDFGTTIRLSVHTNGTEGDSSSSNPAISGDGRIVAFQSNATNLIDLDVNGFTSDIFIRSWLQPTPTTERVSVPDSTMPDADANFSSFGASLSRDGRFISFVSSADNLVFADNNDREDVFVRDTVLSKTVRASVTFQNTEALESSFAAGISADGRFVVFDSNSPNLVLGDGNNAVDVFVRDLVAQTTVRVSVATYGVETSSFFGSFGGSISGSGRFVAFESSAANLTANDTNGVSDVFVRGPLY